MHGDLGWDQLQLMISRSTTADLLKMFYKLEEFFSQQFKSSKRVFSSLQTTTKKPSLRRKAQPKKKTSSGKNQLNNNVLIHNANFMLLKKIFTFNFQEVTLESMWTLDITGTGTSLWAPSLDCSSTLCPIHCLLPARCLAAPWNCTAIISLLPASTESISNQSPGHFSV